MLKKIIAKVLEFSNHILDFVLPVRSDYEIVKGLDEETTYSLPKGEQVQDNDWIHPLFEYKNKKVKAIIWELKYRENILPLGTIGKMFFDEMLEVISDILLFDAKAEFVLIPIPMTTKSRGERGYNQSELIARAIIENDSQRTLLYAPQWFEKIKETPKQSHSQSKIDRTENLVGCFKADERIAGKYVFLIDDVVTTGSTLNEAKKTLLGVGAVDVFGFTIAH